MEVIYHRENDLFCLNINNRKIFYNDYTNEISDHIEDLTNVERRNRKINNDNKFRLKIIPSNSCNLTCEYCFSKCDRSKCEMLNYETVKDTLNNISNMPFDEFSISFTGGGEPTLNFKCIEQIVDLFNEKNNITYNITTNGIFDKKYIPFLIKHKFNVAISIDGNYEFQREQQINQLSIDKYNMAIENAQQLSIAGNEVSILVVLSSKTLKKYKYKEKDIIINTLEYFYNLGLKSISLSFDLDIFFGKEQEIIDCIARVCKETFLWKKNHTDTIIQLKELYSSGSNYNIPGICRGIARMDSNITILPNGKYSFCHRVQKDEYIVDKYQCDNMNEYVNSKPIIDIINKTKKIRENCKSCIARQTYMGDICPALLIESNVVDIKNFCNNNKELRRQMIEFALGISE